MKVIVVATYQSLWTITSRKLGKNNETPKKNILLMFTDKNYDGKFSSMIYNENEDKIKKYIYISSALLTSRLAYKIANKNI
jgi:hypothetical protein